MLSARKQLLIVAVGVFAISVVFLERVRIQDFISAATKPAVPSPIEYPSTTPRPSISVSSTPKPSATPAPTAVNLDIPFVSQAPHMVWDADHEEFCEEAAALMAASYVKGDRSVTNLDVADAALYAAKNWEMQTLGHFEDTTAAETARMLREHFGISAVQVVANPTEQTIKSWVAAGKAVLVPAAGRQLGNPNFKAPGPIYHFIVIKGYTASGQFITNDAGTRKGANYIYDVSVIMNAMHDWNGGDVSNGAKVVIVVG